MSYICDKFGMPIEGIFDEHFDDSIAKQVLEIGDKKLPISNKPTRVPLQIKTKRRNLKVTNIETEAWKLSDTLAKTIEYLHKTDLKESTRRKMIRDILKDNFVEFYIKQKFIEDSLYKPRPNKEV